MPLNEPATFEEAGSTYYAMCWGDCLAGIVPNGGLAEVATDQPIDIGSIVSVVTKQAGVFRQFSHGLELQDLLGVFKIFLGTVSSDGNKIYLFGQLNPPLIAPIPEQEIEALHLLGSVHVTELMKQHPVDETRTAASMHLLKPFFQKCEPVQPINPAWRPPDKENPAWQPTPKEHLQ